jgi:hypothetical protein
MGVSCRQFGQVATRILPSVHRSCESSLQPSRIANSGRAPFVLLDNILSAPELATVSARTGLRLGSDTCR